MIIPPIQIPHNFANKNVTCQQSGSRHPKPLKFHLESLSSLCCLSDVIIDFSSIYVSGNEMDLYLFIIGYY